MKQDPSSTGRWVAALIGDVVGSRSWGDRRALHRQLTDVLTDVATELPGDDPPSVTAGDEFQGSYPTVGEALQAAFLIRVRLAGAVDVRLGIGWGTVQTLDSATGAQDGPAWWQARAAIEAVEDRASRPGTRWARMCYRAGPDGEGPSEPAIEAALMCRDQLMGLLGMRSQRILQGLVAGRTKADIAATEEISASAVSQRAQRDGLDVVVASSVQLAQIT